MKTTTGRSGLLLLLMVMFFFSVDIAFTIENDDDKNRRSNEDATTTTSERRNTSSNKNDRAHGRLDPKEKWKDFRKQRRQWQKNSKNNGKKKFNRFDDTNESNNFKIHDHRRRRRPRHIYEGFWNAMKSTIGGTLVGSVSFLAFPYAVYQQYGWSRMGYMLVSILMGTMTGVLCTLGGMIHGLYRFILGIMETPSAIQAWFTGKKGYDPFLREWFVYSLQTEVNNNDNNNKHQGQEWRRDVRDTTYYDLLEVPTDATTSQIKRAYYQKAKDVHPDKNRDDVETAKTFFLTLHDAYRTLSDDNKRALYDEWGFISSSSSSSPPSSSNEKSTHTFKNTPHVNLFFTVLFGSQPVEPYVGEFAVSTFCTRMMYLQQSLEATTTGGTSNQQEDMAKILWNDMTLSSKSSYDKQNKRQVDIAWNLYNLIEPYVNGSSTKDQFRETCRVEAETIANQMKSVGGKSMLTSLGNAFQLEAKQFVAYHPYHFPAILVSWPKAIFLSYRKRHNQIINSIRFVRTMAKLVQDVYQCARNDDHDDGSWMDKRRPHQKNNTNKKKRFDKSIQHEDLEKLLPNIYHLTWAYTVSDISKTIQSACWKLFMDNDTSNNASLSKRQQRNKRAEAIQILGEEFSFRGRQGEEGNDATSPQDDNHDDDWKISVTPSDLIVRFEVASTVSQTDDKMTQASWRDWEEMIEQESRKRRRLRS